MLRDNGIRVKVVLDTPSTDDVAYVTAAQLGLTDGEMQSLKVVEARKFSAAGVMYNTANDIDAVTIENVTDGTAQGRCLKIAEGTTGFVDNEYWLIDLEPVAEVPEVTAATYTAS